MGKMILVTGGARSGKSAFAEKLAGAVAKLKTGNGFDEGVILGPLIVFETLAGLLYIFILRQSLPPLLTFSGILLLVLGVVSAVRARPEKPMLQPLADEKK